MKDSDRLACCNVCLLADAMKACKECPFNPSRLKLTPLEQASVIHKELLTQSQVKGA